MADDLTRRTLNLALGTWQDTAGVTSGRRGGTLTRL